MTKLSPPHSSPEPGGNILQAYIQSVNEAVNCQDEECIARKTSQQLALLLGAQFGLVLWPHVEGGSVQLSAARITPDGREPEWAQAIDPQGAKHTLDLSLSTGEAVQAQRSRAGNDLGGLLDVLGANSLLLLPTASYAVGVGVREEERVFTEEELRTGKQIVAQAMLLGEHVRMFAEMQQRSHVLEMIYQASLSLTSSLELEHVLNAILKSSAGLIKAALDAHIFLYDQDVLIFGAALRGNEITDRPVAPPRQHGLTYTVARSGQPLVVENLKSHPLFKDAPADWHGAIVGLPLKIGQRVVGVMTMALPVNYPIGEADLRVLRLLGDQAAIAIENARLHRIINQQAHTDVVTGLPNRRSFDERLTEEIRRSNRYDHSFALVMLDLNNFKSINDTFGHPAGDYLLRQVGGCLRKAIRDTDFIARYGGDEFAMIFPETDQSTARQVAGRIHTDLSAFCPEIPEQMAGRKLTTALGIAIYPKHATSETELIAKADQALYEDKRNQKG